MHAWLQLKAPPPVLAPKGQKAAKKTGKSKPSSEDMDEL